MNPGANVRPQSGASMLPPMNETTSTPKPAKRSRAKGRFGEINAFIDATLAELTRAEISVWLILWRDCKPNGLARTSQTDLARRGGMTTKTVKRAVRTLKAKGLIRVVRKGNAFAGSSAYRLLPTTTA